MMNRWTHRLALVVFFSTLGLVFAGGLVTSTHSGLAVPDWPLSYGRWMPPMRGGILFEHGHRMLAAGVGLLTVVLALLLSWSDFPSRVKKAGWAAVGLVVLQGVLGGITVLWRLPAPVSIAHACLAQTFFCVTAVLAAWTSPRGPGSSAARFPALPGHVPLHIQSVLLFCAVYGQLVLGALVRHTGRGLPLHILGAVLVLGTAFWVFGKVYLHQAPKPIRLLSGGILAAVLAQIALGLASYFVLAGGLRASRAAGIAAVTGHVALGALILGLSVLLGLWAWPARMPTDKSSAHRRAQRWADYFALTKPGISVMAGVTALAGFLLGEQGRVDIDRLINTVIGTLLVSAGACALNMVLEADVDARMRRTEKRPLPAGRLRPGEALLFGSLLSVIGILYLSWAVNLLTAFLAGLTLSVYLYLYTPLKKITALCTTAGAVAGALPPVMGWAAATESLGHGAWALFAILFFWQFPHFLSLAWMYKDDYARAGLFMLPALEADGETTAAKVVLNSFALLGASLLPALLGMTGVVYWASALALGAGLTFMGWMFFRDRSLASARRLFLASVLYIPVLLALMVLNKKPPLL